MRLRFGAILLLLGMGWGLTLPLTKIATVGGLDPLGMVFWQLTVGAVALGVILAPRIKYIRPNRQRIVFWIMIALTGTIVPNTFSFMALRQLPAGLVSVLISLIPMMAFPIALLLGNEDFAPRRLFGLVVGLVGVLLIILPDAALPDRAVLIYIPLALIAPFCYAFEGNFVAKWGTHGLDPLEVLFGASVLGALIALPLALGTGQFFVLTLSTWPMQVFFLACLIHVAVYTCYVWLVGQAGAVFAGQVSYIVTAAGVIWAMLILGESFGIWFWAAFVLILGGVALVQPRFALADDAAERDTAP